MIVTKTVFSDIRYPTSPGFKDRHPNSGRGFIYDPDLDPYIQSLNWKLNSGQQWRAYSPRHKGPISIHRLIMGDPRDADGKALLVDHCNGDIMDIRKANLRIATHRENSINREYGPDVKVKGVSFNKRSKQWIAYISTEAGNRTWKRFDSFQDACKQRFEWEAIYDGKFGVRQRYRDGLKIEIATLHVIAGGLTQTE